ncbi:MAG: D-alanyl-D-alanine carboxypeptidase/D-alanyl-D-alanine endopeptidase [Burkholderiales bacterium]
MKRLVFILIVWLTVWLTAANLASAALPAPVAKALRQAGIPEKDVGVFVQDVTAAKPLLAHRAESPMNPASTMKLVTTYAALELMGPAYVWDTEFYAVGERRGDVLDGDLVIKGYGDPKLTLENLWLALREMRQRGLREIRGDLVLDRSFFAVKPGDPGGFDNEPLRPYNVTPSALLINFNAIRLQFIPGAANTVQVIADPQPPGLRIDNRVTLSTGACGDWSEKIAAGVERSAGNSTLVLAGAYASSCLEKTRHYSVLDQTPYIYGVFRQLWEELGGTLRGSVREASALPASAQLLYTHYSPPLAEIVRDINKFSNNVMARQLFLSIGAFAHGPPATAESAAVAIKEWLAGKRLLNAGLVLENGSGLSRIERIAPQTLARMLINAYGSALMPEFIGSLPLTAVDGTMKKRLIGSAVSGRAHIKTGSLENVNAIAGYVLDEQGKMKVVVSIVNHANASGAQAAHDALLQWAYWGTYGGDKRGR